VAVIGVPDEKWGERPLALIVVKESVPPPDPKELVGHVRAYIDRGLLSKLALLVQVRYVSAIDKTSVGKTNKKFLREKFVS
jgi:fatty-acyl-CoA synthase